MKEEIQIKKRTLYLVVASLLFLGIFLYIFNSESVSKINLNSNSLEARFERLSAAGTNFCAGPNILDLTDSKRLQGSCCSAMDIHHYKEQIEGLKKYSDYEIIPKDPYDVPVKWAEEMIDYSEKTVLDSEQQKVYDDAVSSSHEGGPCCCKCWHWYAYEGLAKYLIINENFSSEQIAEVWDLSDACGGAGHVEGEHK